MHNMIIEDRVKWMQKNVSMTKKKMYECPIIIPLIFLNYPDT
jgi:hypothetical protein